MSRPSRAPKGKPRAVTITVADGSVVGVDFPSNADFAVVIKDYDVQEDTGLEDDGGSFHRETYHPDGREEVG